VVDSRLKHLRIIRLGARLRGVGKNAKMEGGDELMQEEMMRDGGD
jgi:hypothetical protein